MIAENICYLLSNYRSHHSAGTEYQRSIANLGYHFVDDPADAATVIIHDEPWTYPGYFRAFPTLTERFVVAYAVWEPDRLPTDVLRWLKLADEIWTSSTHCRCVMEEAGLPIAVIPHIVTQPALDPDRSNALRARLGLSETAFVFYAITKIEERKNIEAGIRAFVAAFPEQEPVFIVKTPTPLRADLSAIPGVVSWSGNADDHEIAALHDIGNCFVSPHCAEGWGLAISDAMAHGNLVVATGFSGNMDYMTNENSLPVKFVVDSIKDPQTLASFGFSGSSIQPCWAYIDEQDLSSKLRLAHDNWHGLVELRECAKTRMALYAADIVGRQILPRLDARKA